MLKKLLIKDKHYQHIRLNCEIFLKENLLSRPKNSPNKNKRKNKKDAKSEMVIKLNMISRYYEK